MSTVTTDLQTSVRFSGEWETKQLGDIARIKTGSKNNEDKDENGQYPLFVRSSIVERINSYCYDGEAILIPGEGGIESIFHYINGRFDCHQRVYMINRFTDDVCGKLVYYSMVLQFGSHAMKNTVKATVDSLRLPTFQSFSFPIPKDMSEQHAITEALSDVDGLLNALDALIAKKQAIKQASMQQLLTGKTRLPGFSGEWETKQLGEIGEISGAGVDKKVNPNEVSVRLVNYLDVYNKTFLYSKDLTHEVSARPDQVRRCAIEKGDVFFTPSSEVPDDIGCSAVAMEDISDGVYSYHVVRLRLKMDWDLYFRAYIFDTNEFLNQASRQCEGSGTRYVITLPRFRAMTVRFPPDIEEQRAIAAVLSDMDAEITALEQRRDKTRAIKQGMMQQLLTGRVRLVKFDADQDL